MVSPRLMRAAAWSMLLLVLAAVATYVAGEQTEVVVLRTFDGAGDAHDTKMWVVDLEGGPWVRVANPHRLWFERLRNRPQAVLVRGGVEHAVTAHPDESPETRAAVDRAFRSKYGWVDGWYGVLLRRGAVPIRLELDRAP